MNDRAESMHGRRLLLLSVGYGQGHHSAAAAIAEQYGAEGWNCRTVDVCAAAHPAAFRLSQSFYHFCVRKAPWLWGITYSLTDTANWARMVRSVCFCSLLDYLKRLLRDWNPALIICTYPLFAYMLDELRRRGNVIPPYALVVTDAREISRPWMRSLSSLVMLPDAGSASMVMNRYALDSEIVKVTGFPVRPEFKPASLRRVPDEGNLHILYGAYRQTQGVINDIAAMLSAFPGLHLVVLAGARSRYLQHVFAEECASGRLVIMAATNQMHLLLQKSHFYIGKAGAATMFECYSTEVPVLINYTLPGQEQGNLELLLEDGAGYHVESTAHLVATLNKLLQDEASGWKLLCASMKTARRSGGAKCVVETIRSKFGI